MTNLLLKQNMTDQELTLVQSEMAKRHKSNVVAWLLWLFLGTVGAHRYYLGKTKSAIAMTLTLGGVGIWTLIDLFFVSKMIREANEAVESQIIIEIKNIRDFKNQS